MGPIIARLLLATGLASSASLASPSDALQRASTWIYQLQNYDLGRLARSEADLIVIDYSRDGTEAGAFTRAEIERLKTKPDGSRRPVTAYLSIGEAETYRFYWQDDWRGDPPDWLLQENCRWPGNYIVKFWDPAWKELIYRGSDPYLERVISAGFDGVYLDRVDVYWDLRKTHPGGRDAMIAFVRELAETARKARPGFLVIAQNAESLLADPDYRETIDAIAKEDLLFGVDGTGRRNSQQMINWSLHHLNLLHRENKPVFVVEYLRKADQIASVASELEDLGYRATFEPRALDGTDPLTVPAKDDESGTPEHRAKRCP